MISSSRCHVAQLRFFSSGEVQPSYSKGNTNANRRKNVVLGLLLIAAIGFTAGCGQANGNSDESMTGVWFTQAPASWIVETQVGAFSGSTQMRWELEENSNGTISGFNPWHSPSTSGGPGTGGAYCMLGAREGSRLVITEASVEDRLKGTFSFTCTQLDRLNLRCLGAGFADQPPIALRGQLTREEEPASNDAEIPSEVISEVRDFCNGSTQTVPYLNSLQ